MKTSRGACYAMVDDFIDVVNSTPELNITFPQNADEWRAANEGYRHQSFNHIMG